jgi:alpha-tubulin suppressor-like RCC1 family protein
MESRKAQSRVSPSLSVGNDHVCYREPDGEIYCWGDNGNGELGDATSHSSLKPVAVVNMTGTKAVSAGSGISCAILQRGGVVCWGLDIEVPAGASFGPTPMGVYHATQISAGGAWDGSHACALISNHTVECWGNDYYGQLGGGGKRGNSAPVRAEGIRNAVQVSAGARHSCALLSSGRIDCWGYGKTGQLGNGTERTSRLPSRVKHITHALEVSAGGDQTCAVVSGGAVKCWGGNGNGELGIGKKNLLESPVPLKVKLPGKAVSVSAGTRSTCALLDTGAVYCWGANDFDQLGTGETFDELAKSYSPLRVANLDGATAVSVGAMNACALTSGGVECWGDNSLGLVTEDMGGSSPTPVAVQGLANVASVYAGPGLTCAVLSGGRVSCWGINSGGQLGVSPVIKDRSVPLLLPKIEHAVRVAGTTDHACALISDGTVECWGANNAGQLGNGKKTMSLAPVKVKGISNAIEVGAGPNFSCALLSGGAVKCWGYNGDGELGNGASERDHLTPVRVSGVTNAVSLDVGVGSEYSACVVLASGRVECWGNCDPDDPMSCTGSDSPTDVGISSAVEASVESECALISDGTVTCWELDPLAAQDQPTFHEITGLENAVHISGNCALLASGGVDCWEYLGSEDTAVPIPGITSALQVSSSAIQVSSFGSSACALLSDRTVECWGSNSYGQLGNEQSGFSPVPVPITGLP